MYRVGTDEKALIDNFIRKKPAERRKIKKLYYKKYKKSLYNDFTDDTSGVIMNLLHALLFTRHGYLASEAHKHLDHKVDAVQIICAQEDNDLIRKMVLYYQSQYGTLVTSGNLGKHIEKNWGRPRPGEWVVTRR